MKIAPEIHRLGKGSIVNSYLVDDGGEVTILDAGVPGLYNDIPRERGASRRGEVSARI